MLFTFNPIIGLDQDFNITLLRTISECDKNFIGQILVWHLTCAGKNDEVECTPKLYDVCNIVKVC